MKRDLLEKLKLWAEKKEHKPLILRGPRQVGKSWLVQELGKEFDNFVEINFEMMPEIEVFFNGNLHPEELIKDISNYTKQKIIPGKTLLFFDEIQQVPKAITALRYFYEKMPELHVIAAGSLLEFELKNISIPVGRVSFMYVYPLSFGEFLTAVGSDNLRNLINENNWKELAKPFHDNLLKELRRYCVIGGMPEVVKKYVETSDLEECMNIQSDVIQTYISDFNKYAKDSQIKYLSKVFDSVPHQIGEKFKYSAVDKNVKSTFFGDALNLLEMAGVVYKVYHTSSNGIPLGAEANLSRFKVLFFDVGLAQRILGLDYKSLLINPDISQINNGAIAELFVGLELITYGNDREKPSIHYWHREARSSNAEIDYVISLNGKIIPVEVKSGTTGSMKSLQLFLNLKKSDLGLKISSYNYSFEKGVQSIPFYGIENLMRCSDLSEIQTLTYITK